MRHRMDGRKLSRPTGHRMSMYYNLAADLLRYEKITTTHAKAKEAQGIAEKIITLGKAGSISARRSVLAIISDKQVVDKVFDEIAPRYANRSGGYTSISKIGPRFGDGAQMSRLELVS